MPSFIVDAPLDRVLDNPNRDFENYPIDEAQVARLMASYTDTGGQWHAIPARRKDKDAGGWTYELAFGHHRKAAAKRLGLRTMRLEVEDLDDDMMNLMLVTENATQRVNNAAASLDSVAAITRRLAYLLLRFNDLDHLGRILPTSEVNRLFDSEKAFDTNRGLLLKGDGVGHRLILKYAPAGALDEHEVRNSIATLKQTGGYQRVIQQATARVNAELAAEQAEREAEEAKEREWQEQKAKQEHDRQEAEERKAAAQKEREEKAKAKAEADRKAAEERRKAAEAKQEKAAAEKAKRDEEKAEREKQAAAARLAQLATERKEREKAAAQAKADREAEQAKRKAEQQAAQAEQERREAESAALEIKAAKTDPLLDSRVVPMFRNHYALGKFRQFVTDEDNRHWFPVKEQLGHVKAMFELFEKEPRHKGKAALDNITANYVSSYLNGYLRECLRGKREDERRQRSLDDSFDAELAKALKGASWIAGATVDMIQLLKNGASVPHDFEEKLRDLEDKSCDAIARLRTASGYVKGGKEIAGKAVASRARLTISDR